jgi:glycosyltransferase involved in cell wall biosynthesis
MPPYRVPGPDVTKATLGRKPPSWNCANLRLRDAQRIFCKTEELAIVSCLFKMKVLHVTPSFYPAHVYGGPTQAVYELCRNLAKLGSEVRVLTTDTNGLDKVLDVEKDQDVFVEGFRVRYCRRRFRHSVSPTLVRLLRPYTFWADVVHLHYVYSFPTFPTLLQCRLLGKPVIWSPLGALQRWQGSSRRALKAIWDSSWYYGSDRSRLTLLLNSEQERLNTADRFPRLRTCVIPNGVEVPSELHATERTEDLRLLFIGRLDPIKGIENLLRACGELSANADLRWRLAIAGWADSTYVSHLKQQISNLGLQDRISMVGGVLGEAKKKLFEDSDLVIVPSHSESFGLVVAEALAHGVPVIASKGTPWSGLEQKQCGLWVENDPESLATAIRKITAMPLRDMGLRGRVWMQREFSWETIAKRTLDLYRESVSA